MKMIFFEMKKYCLFIFLFLAGFTVFSQSKTETVFLNSGGLERSYEVFIPKNYSQKNIYPLVFVLHGGGGKARGMIRLTHARFNQLANRDGFIVVYPNGYEKSWNDGARDTFGVARKLNINDVKFFSDMIDDLQQKLQINADQIFACGISNGGFMAQRLAFELPDKIKAIGVVAANLSVVQSEKPNPTLPVQVMFINGTRDPLVPFNGGFVTVLNNRRGEVLSVERSIERWKEINGCKGESEVYIYPDKDKKDGCSAVKKIWLNPKNKRQKVVAITVENGGHTWPGGRQYLPVRLVGHTCNDFDECDEIWNFFKSIE